MKKKKIEQEIEKRLLCVLSECMEINSMMIAYEKKVSKKELKKFKNKLDEKYGERFDDLMEMRLP